MKIVNYVEVDGQTLRMEELSDGKRKETEEKLADRIMEAANFERGKMGDIYSYLDDIRQ